MTWCYVSQHLVVFNRRISRLTEVLNNLLDGQNLKRSKMGWCSYDCRNHQLMKSKKKISSLRFAITTANWHKIIDEIFRSKPYRYRQRPIQRILRSESDSLVVALKGCDQELRRFLNNISQRAAESCVMTWVLMACSHVSKVGSRAESNSACGTQISRDESCSSWRRRYLCLINDTNWKPWVPKNSLIGH